MTTTTLPISAMPKTAATKQKGWFARALDRAVEARTRQAETHVRDRLSHLPPELLEQVGYRQAGGNIWTLPFVRGA